MSPDLKAIVRDGNKAKFSHYRDSNFFYVVKVQEQAYSFPIPIEDAKGTRFFAEFKAHSNAMDSESDGRQNVPTGEIMRATLLSSFAPADS